MDEMINISCAIYVDPVNASTESMQSAAREMVELEKQIGAAKRALFRKLTERKDSVDSTLQQLLPTI